MRNLIIPTLILGVLAAARLVNGYLLTSPFEITHLQLVIFPVICLGLLIWLRRVSLAAMISVAAVLLTGEILALNSQFHFFHPHGTVFFTRLSGDTDDAMTREFSQKVSKAASQAASNVYFQQHFESVGSDKDAQLVMLRFKKATAIVYGSKRWLQIAINPALSLAKFEFPLSNPNTPARLVTYVPGFGMSADPINETAQFLGYFFGAIESRDDAEKLRLLDAAASLKARWTLLGHSAYARWMEGSILLQRALESSPLQVSEISCALTKLTLAQRYLRPPDNPLLLAAVINNKSIAAAVLYHLQGQDLITPSLSLQEVRQGSKLRRLVPASPEAKDIFSTLKQTAKALRTNQPKRPRSSLPSKARGKHKKANSDPEAA